jgi:hypothetical protein
MAYLVKENNTIVFKYRNSSYPSEQIDISVKSDKTSYAKIHSLKVRMLNYDCSVYNKTSCYQAQTEWLQNNPYYPLFTANQLYNGLLTSDNDIQNYETAKIERNTSNSEKLEEIKISSQKDSKK